ncbi:MAG: dolichol kinase [Ignavibacteriota bacterium]
MTQTKKKSDANSDAQISMSGELLRKVIHISSLSIPIAYYFLPRSTTVIGVVGLTLLALLIDYGKFYIKPIDRFYHWAFDPILREHERDMSRKLLSGGSYVLISACICVLVFPKIIAITAFSILIISDTASALIGRRFGKNHFLDKSFEGTIAFIVSAWIVVLIAPKNGSNLLEYIPGIFAAVVGGIIEAMSVRLRVDDNFSVPVSIGLTMWLGYFLLAAVIPSTFGPIYEGLLK